MRKRFIAGAVCPRCGAMDRLHVYELEGVQYKACVACEFEEKMLVSVAADELATRVNHLDDSEIERQESVSIVKIIGPGKSGSEH